MLALVEEKGSRTATKFCPRCGEELFEDMSICYGCLYDFDKKIDGASDQLTQMQKSIADRYELEDLDEIEEVQDFLAAKVVPEPRSIIWANSHVDEDFKIALPQNSFSDAPDDENPSDYVPSIFESDDEFPDFPTEEFPQLENAVNAIFAPISIRLRTSEVDLTLQIEQQLLVGRAPACDVVLHSAAISRQHALFTIKNSELYVEDLGSRNPPLLKGRLVKNKQLIKRGETLSICGNLFTRL